jgi:hypothetical protein
MTGILKAGGLAAAIALGALAVSMPASADIGDFLGQWRNVDPWTNGITRISVTAAGPLRLFVRVWGECHPADCDWGARPAHAYTLGVNSTEIRTLTANFNAGFADDIVILRRAPSGQLSFEVLTHFTDRSGRRDYDQSGRLSRW